MLNTHGNNVESLLQTHTIQVFLMIANSPVTVAVSKMVGNQTRMDLRRGVHTLDLVEDTLALLQDRDGGMREEGERGEGGREGGGKGWKVGGKGRRMKVKEGGETAEADSRALL